MKDGGTVIVADDCVRLNVSVCRLVRCDRVFSEFNHVRFCIGVHEKNMEGIKNHTKLDFINRFNDLFI